MGRNTQQAGVAATARNRAVRELVRRHGKEFDKIHAAERGKVGLPAELTGHSNAGWRPPKPCRGCGGKKDRGVNGARYCTACHEDRLERKRQQNTAGARKQRATKVLKPCRGCGGEKERGRPGSYYCVACEEVTKETRQARVQRIERKPRVVKVKAAKPKVPREIRTIWGEAKPNSIMRRKYPTMKDLEKAYGVTS